MIMSCLMNGIDRLNDCPLPKPNGINAKTVHTKHEVTKCTYMYTLIYMNYYCYYDLEILNLYRTSLN